VIHMARRLTFEEAWRLGESLPPIRQIGRPLLTQTEWQQLSRCRRLIAWLQLRYPLKAKERRRLGLD